MKEANTQFALRKSTVSFTSFAAVILYTVAIVASIVSAVSTMSRLIDLIYPYLSEIQSYLPYIEYAAGVDIDLVGLFNRFTAYLMGGTLGFAITAALPKILIAAGLWMILISAMKDGPMTSAGFTMIKVMMILNIVFLIFGTILADALLALMIPILQTFSNSDMAAPVIIVMIITYTIGMLLCILFYGFAAKSLTRAREVSRNGGEEDDVRLSGYVGFFCIAGGAIACIASFILLLAGTGASVAGSTAVSGLTNLFFGIAIFKCRSNLRRADILAKPFYNPPEVVRPQGAEEPAQGAAVYPQPAPGPYGAPRKIVIRGKSTDSDDATGTFDFNAPTEDAEPERPAFCPDCGEALPALGKFCPRCGCRL